MASPANNSGASEPKKKSSYTLKLTSGQMDKLANALATADGQPVKFPMPVMHLMGMGLK